MHIVFTNPNTLDKWGEWLRTFPPFKSETITIINNHWNINALWSFAFKEIYHIFRRLLSIIDVMGVYVLLCYAFFTMIAASAQVIDVMNEQIVIDIFVFVFKFHWSSCHYASRFCFLQYLFVAKIQHSFLFV